MRFTTYFNNFCNKHGYVGNMGFDKKTNEYNIVISKGDDNAGLFMTKEELQAHSDEQLEELLNILHNGFKAKFNK